jgi:hypothetical protein
MKTKFLLGILFTAITSSSFSQSLGLPTGATNSKNGHSVHNQNKGIGNSSTQKAQPFPGGPPTIISQPVNASACAGSNSSFSVTASGAGLSYQWQESAGGAYTNLSDTGVYSGTASPTLALNALPAGMNAYTYQCIVSGTSGPNVTSAAATLNVSLISVTLTSSVNVSCNGGNNGSASVTANGGTISYSYSWSSGGMNATENGLAAGTYTCYVSDSNSCAASSTVTITEPNILSASISSSVNVSCHGEANGSASVTANGGTASYSYNWTPAGGTASTINGLPAGTYTCTVNDANNCTASTTVTITEPNILSASISSSANVSCHGGANGNASVTANGGTASYSYNWTPAGGTASTINGQPAGTYTCTLNDANNCIASTTVTITEPLAVTASISSTIPSGCSYSTDGSASVSASGGTGTITYSWSPSGQTKALASGLHAGTYTCSVTDSNGCSVSAIANVTVLDATAPVISGLPVNMTVYTSTACDAAASWIAPSASDNCTLVSFSGSATSGQSFPIGISTVTYTAIDSSGNTSNSSFTVTVLDTSKPVFSSCPSSISTGLSNNIVTYAQPVATDNCSFNLVLSAGLPSGSAFPVGVTTVTYTATDASGNSMQCSFTVTVNAGQMANIHVDTLVAHSASFGLGGDFSSGGFSTGINQEEVVSELKAFPNPASTQVTILLSKPETNCVFYLYNLSGQLLQATELHSALTIIERGNLVKGTYMYQVLNGNKQLSIGRIVFID